MPVRTIARVRVERETFGARVKRLRTERGLTQFELATKTGISYPTIQRIEGGYPGALAHTVADLADGLGTCMSYLFSGRRCTS